MQVKLIVAMLAFSSMVSSAFAQDVMSPFYVVVGGFKQEENARRFTTYAQEQNLPAVYAYNEERKVYYVFVRATETRDVAYEISKSLRATTVFKDAWVFNGPLSGGTLMTKNQAAKPEKEPAPEPVMAVAPVEETPDETAPAAVPVESPAKPVEAPKPVGKAFVFRLVHAETGNSVNGLVRLQESDRAKQFRGFNANEKVYVPAPSNKSGRWYVVSQVIGFKMARKPVVYERAQETKGASLGPEEEVIIPLELERVKKGDYIEMEGVKFYNNSALFASGSERELNELVAMMEENPDYHIRLHGHTNGNQDRDIVSLGTSTDFFNPDASNEKTHASAKQLSLLRAELVKSYLVSKGIDTSRITTKGEGGKQMVFDPSGTLAGLNDRVEAEIRKH